jgi:hypothetical protein
MNTHSRPRQAWGFARGVATRGLSAGALTAAVLVFTGAAWGHPDPPGCDVNGSVARITQFPSTARHGREICYTVEIDNRSGASGLNCNVTDLDTQLVLPDGSSVTITDDATVNEGETFACPSSDVRCTTPTNCTIPGRTGYRYLVNHDDEHGPTGVDCPPTPPAGFGQVSAYIESLPGSTVHMKVDAGASLCKAIAATVPHACYNPCTCACTEVAAEGACPSPFVFDSDISCKKLNCTKPNCSDNKTCTLDACDPAVPGLCVHTPNHDSCDDGIGCTNPDLCDPGHPAADPLTGCRTPPVHSKCDDGVACTVDTCDAGLGRCVYTCQTPGITCPPSTAFECDDVGEFGDPTIDDTCSADPAFACSEESTPGKLPQERTIVRTCTTTNDCGNSAACTHQIEITDNTPPTITCPPELEFECDAVGDFGEPTITDTCDPDPEVTIEVETVINDCSQPQTAGVTPPPKISVTRTLTGSDGSSTAVATGGGPNTAQCVQHIDIFDTTPPVIVDCPEEVTACAPMPLEFTPPTCTDTCGTCAVTCTRGDGEPLNAPVDSGTTITCTAQDECDNSSVPCEIAVVFGEDCFIAIPTLSQWGLIILALLLLAGAKIRFSAPNPAANP